MQRDTKRAGLELPHLAVEESPPDIAIVGIGPGRIEDVPLGVWMRIQQAEQVIFRTRRHPSIPHLGIESFESCDDLYEGETDFSEVYRAIVDRVIDAAREGPLVYAVPGNPWVGEATTGLIQAAAQRAELSLVIEGGASFIEPAFGAVGVDPLDGAQIVDAMVLAHRHHPRLDLALPTLVGQIYSREIASEVKMTLLNAYPADHPVSIVRHAGFDSTIEQIALHELDHRAERFDHLTALYLPPFIRSSMSDLQELIAHLRAPEGCPWDQEQTIASLANYLLDETYELLEAIAEEDDRDSADELGDLLGIVTMIGQVAAEEGRFLFGDAVRASVEKLTRRHPHVFAQTEINDLNELHVQWEAIKAEERSERGKERTGPFDGIPAALPALEKARQTQSRARKAGLVDRKELIGDQNRLNLEEREKLDLETVGEVLWRLVALADRADLNAEEALRTYTVGMQRRLDT